MSATTLGPVDIEFLLKGLNFQQEAEKMKSQLRGISTAAQSEADRIDNAFRMAFTGMAAYFTIDAASSFVSDLVRVRGEFQQLDIAFTTMLGSKEKSDRLMAQTVQLAANTPYSLLQIAQVEKGLIAFGENSENVADTVTRLGNIASGTGANISELGQAYGKVMSKGKMQAEELNQFTERGVPIVAELAKMYGVTAAEVYKMVEQGKVGFTDLKQVIKNVTDEGGMFYNLMEKQSKTLTGQISNLGDAWDNMLNQMGTSSEGLLSGGIQTAISIVNNYQDVLDVLKVLIATYGSYKAALILAAVHQKAVAAGTFVSEYLKMGRALGFATANQIAFNGALIANPISLAIGAAAGLISLLIVYGNKNRELTLAEKSKAAALDSATTSFNQQRGSITMLLETAHKQSLSDKQRLEAITKLKETIPGYNAELSKEGKIINENTAAVENYLKQLELKIKAEAIQGELNKLWSDEVTIKRELKAATAEYNKEIKNNKVITESMAVGEAGIAAQVSAFQTIEKASSKVEDVNKRLKENADAVAVLKGEYSDSEKSLTSFFAASDKGTKTTIRSVDVIDAEITKLTAERKARSDSAKVYEEYTKRIAKLEAEKEAITGKKAEKEQSKELKDKAKEELVALKEQLSAAKDAYDGDLICYSEYLEERAKLITDKDKVEVITDEQKSNNKAIKNQLDSLLEKYRTYEEQRAAISEEFAKERGLLGNNQSAIDENKKAEKEKLAELERNHLKETKSYRYLFDNIDRLSANALKQRIARLNEDLKATSATVEEKLAMEKALAEATDMLTSKAPFAALTEYRRRVNELKKQIDNEKDDAKKLQLQKELDDTTQKQGVAISSAFSDVSQHLSESTELAGYLGKELQEVVSTASQVASAIGKIASGDKVGGIIQIIGVLAQANDKWQKKQEAKAEEEKQDRIKRSNELVAEANQLYSEQLDLLSRIKGVQLYGALEDTSDTLLASLKEVNDAVENLYIKDRTKYHDDWEWSRSGIAGVSYGKKRKYDDYDFSKLNGAMETALKDPTFGNTEAAKDQIAEIIKLIGKWGDGYDTTIFGDTEELKKQLEVYKEMLKKAEELAALRIEKLTGSTTDSMVDALSSGFEDGVYSAEEFADTFEGLMKKAILESLKITYLDGQMKIWSSHFADAMSDGALTEEEAAKLRTEMQDIKDKAAAGLSAINQAGIDLLGDAGSKAEGLSGAIQGMSQEEAGLMAGQLGAMRIHLADIATAITGQFNADLKDVWKTPADALGGNMVTMNDSLLLMKDSAIKANRYLEQIEINTRKLGNIETLLSKKNSIPNRRGGYEDSFRESRITGR